MRCQRCGATMKAIVIRTAFDECLSYACYRCGEVIDEQILKNRKRAEAVMDPRDGNSFKEISGANCLGKQEIVTSVSTFHVDFCDARQAQQGSRLDQSSQG